MVQRHAWADALRPSTKALAQGFELGHR